MSIRSPGTSSVLVIVCSFPSRITTICGADRSLSALSVLSGFPFLDHVNADDADDKNQHDGAISRLSENKINDSGNHQQKEHRLTEGMKNGFEETVLLLRHQFIFAVLLLSLGDLIMGQPLSGSS